MSTKALIRELNESELISQGDIFKNVKFSYIESEDDDIVDIVEMEFPLAIIVSQACDVRYMCELQENNGGKTTKYMPSILMCPIYSVDSVKSQTNFENINNNLINLEELGYYSNTKDGKTADQDLHYRYHLLTVKDVSDIILENLIIDFKHYFSVPMSYLLKNKKNRYCSLESIFSEQITLKFANYLSRVAIP